MKLGKSVRFVATILSVLSALSVPVRGRTVECPEVSTLGDGRTDEAESIRPVLAQYSLEVGGSMRAETYLSPLRYSGTEFALSHTRAQAMKFDPDHWLMELGGRLSLDHLLNRPARNSVNWNINLSLQWAMLHKWQLPKGFSVYAGGFTNLGIGASYLPRNGNNPVSAKASWTVGPRAGAGWRGKLGKLPLEIRYMTDIPLTGIFFSPAYGELYYEIYLGNDSGLVRGAWPGNYFRMDNLLSADLYIGTTALRIGYAPRFFSSKASDLVSRHVSHNFVIGAVHSWTAVPPSGLTLETAKIIHAY